MGQLAQAHRDRLESGQPLLEIIVDRGWVTPEELAEFTGEPAVPARAPEPVAETPAAPASERAPERRPEPAPEPRPEPEPAAETQVRETVQTTPVEPAAKPSETHVLVGIRLTTGDLVPAGHAKDADTAATLGQAVVAELMQAGDDEWPFFDGRFIKPETIVSVDLVVED